MRDHSDMCFITFVTNHGAERASNALIPEQQILILWNQLKHLSMF